MAKSNQEAKGLYQVEPFKEDQGHWRSEDHHRLWEAPTCSGGQDLTAKVTFDEKGAVLSVDVRMLGHPSHKPSTNLDRLFGPPKLGIPEVMPR